MCDGNDNCNDQSDENNLICGYCTAGEFPCKNGQGCVRKDLVCDDYSDCSDDSDESELLCDDWECDPGYFKCHDGKCINMRYRCDGMAHRDTMSCVYFNIHRVFKVNSLAVCPFLRVDCRDGSDEMNCAEYLCPIERPWKCDNGQCISEIYVCGGQLWTGPHLTWDEEPDGCSDESDELEANCLNFTCPPDRSWKCNNGECIGIDYVCDGGDTKCIDGSDEMNCTRFECPETRSFKCTDNLQCISTENVCDRQMDCNDKSDEHNLLCKYCNDTEWPCQDGQGCVSLESVCDGFSHCPDASDESIETCSAWQCPDDKWKCKDESHCIDARYVCDGRTAADFWWYGCKDGSDESHCDDLICDEHEWLCKNHKQCIDKGVFCDGKTDCIDKSDEHNDVCGHCGKDEWPCHDGKWCIKKEQVCDHQVHCADGSDEARDICVTAPCLPGQFKCRNGRCMLESKVCDSYKSRYQECYFGYCWTETDSETCQDDSDEDSVMCVKRKCKEGMWRCDSGQCISEDKRCNGELDCTDKSDEEFCSQPIGAGQCRSGWWMCGNNKCIVERKVCDGDTSIARGNCEDVSDEILLCVRSGIVRLVTGSVPKITAFLRVISVIAIVIVIKQQMKPSYFVAEIAFGVGGVTMDSAFMAVMYVMVMMIVKMDQTKCHVLIQLVLRDNGDAIVDSAFLSHIDVVDGNTVVMDQMKIPQCVLRHLVHKVDGNVIVVIVSKRHMYVMVIHMIHMAFMTTVAMDQMKLTKSALHGNAHQVTGNVQIISALVRIKSAMENMTVLMVTNQMRIAPCVLHGTAQETGGNVPMASVLTETKFVMEV